MRDGNGMIHPLLHSQKLSFILRVKFQVLCTVNKQRWWRGLINLETLQVYRLTNQWKESKQSWAHNYGKVGTLGISWIAFIKDVAKSLFSSSH